MEDLVGRVGVITGGGSGIGAAMARACASAGMAVVVVDIDRGRAETVAASIDSHGKGPLAVGVDVTDPDAVDALAEQVYDTFGEANLLCNNAGVSPLGLAWEFTPADWQWIVGVNLMGVVNGVRSFVPRMIAQSGDAHIVNTASQSALRAIPRLGAYCATKHAVLGLSDSLRVDLEPYGIGISSLCPGGVNTNIMDSMMKLPSGPPSSSQLAGNVEALVGGSDEANSVAIEPDRVAALVLAAVRANDPYIMTSPGSREVVAKRFEEILRAHDIARERDPGLP